MINKLITVIVVLGFTMSFSVKADEGMWLPIFIKRLNYVDMQREGLNLTSEEIYSVNNSSLKDAIVNFGGFCTGEVISNEGLILTNHHCGFGTIAELSSEKNDYLTDGFWAYKKSDELKPKNLFVSFLVQMEDVTNEIQKELNNEMSEQERADKIKEIKKAIIKLKSDMSENRFVIKDFFKGNEFYLFEYKDYYDVRLVGTPPSSIGKFGGDTDNWMWPRHTGDFSIFRVYSDADGNPAEYSKTNVPLTPKHHLPISLKDKKEGDYAMIMGYPGKTSRYLPSWGVKQAVEVEYPAVVKILNAKLEIMRKYMKLSDKTKIEYASNYAGFANYWKNRIGMISALNKLNTVDKKEKIEADFSEWLKKNNDKNDLYGDAIPLFKKYYSNTNDYVKARTLLMLGPIRGNNVFKFVLAMREQFIIYAQADYDTKKVMKSELIKQSNVFFDKLNIKMEQEMLTKQLEIYSADASKKFQPEDFIKLSDKLDGDYNKYINKAFSKSLYMNKKYISKFLSSPKLKQIDNDRLGELIYDLSEYNLKISNESKAQNQVLLKAYRLYTSGLRDMNPDKAYYPDANFTMRVTYGQILPYEFKDAVKYNTTTTIDGIMAKMDSTNAEFIVPQKLVELFNNKDYGDYANNKGELIVNFLSNNDITGGNSGSPVIDGNGNLIGTAFDGNWEAMSGDVEFEQSLQRTISVDIRYTLFIIDKFAGAKNLIKEMTIIK